MNKLFTLLALFVCSLSLSAQTPRMIESRKNAQTPQWSVYPTVTLDRLPGFRMKKTDPGTDIYGGWKARAYEATGFFRTELIDGRWWIIDPEGHVDCIKI